MRLNNPSSYRMLPCFCHWYLLMGEQIIRTNACTRLFLDSDVIYTFNRIDRQTIIVRSVVGDRHWRVEQQRTVSSFLSDVYSHRFTRSDYHWNYLPAHLKYLTYERTRSQRSLRSRLNEVQRTVQRELRDTDSRSRSPSRIPMINRT